MNEKEAIESAVAELVSQPDLFAPGAAGAIEAGILAVDAPLLFAAGTIRRPHTGERVTKDQGRALLIGALKLRGMSDRRIAESVGCDRRTIARVMERLEANSVVPPLKQRLASKVGRLAESVSDELDHLIQEALWTRDSTSALKGLAVALGIATEKGLLLTGQATEIRANAAAAVPTAEELNAWVGTVQTPGPARPSDSVSDVLPTNAPNSGGSGPVDTRLTTSGPVLDVAAEVWPVPAAGSGSAAGGRPGGEGVAARPDLANPDGSTPPQNFDHGGNND
jgi:hypothetical protein